MLCDAHSIVTSLFLMQIAAIMSAPPPFAVASPSADRFSRLIDQIEDNAIQTVQLRNRELTVADVVLLCNALAVSHSTAMQAGEM